MAIFFPCLPFPLSHSRSHSRLRSRPRIPFPVFVHVFQCTAAQLLATRDANPPLPSSSATPCRATHPAAELGRHIDTRAEQKQDLQRTDEVVRALPAGRVANGRAKQNAMLVVVKSAQNKTTQNTHTRYTGSKRTRNETILRY